CRVAPSDGSNSQSNSTFRSYMGTSATSGSASASAAASSEATALGMPKRISSRLSDYDPELSNRRVVGAHMARFREAVLGRRWLGLLLVYSASAGSTPVEARVPHAHGGQRPESPAKEEAGSARTGTRHPRICRR